MVDQRRGVDDQVDGVGQPLPGLRVQAEVGLALVAGDDLEMIGGQLLVVRQQLRVAAVEGLVEPVPGGLVGLGAHQADQLAVDQVHPLQPFQRQVAAEEAGGAGQQDGAHLAGRPRQAGAAASVVASMNLSSVRSLACTSGDRGRAPRRSRPLGALPLGLDVVGDGRQVVGRADDDADRHVDVEDLVQQVGECQRGQRVSAEIGEVRVG